MEQGELGAGREACPIRTRRKDVMAATGASAPVAF
jgi:hypothetical protein